MTYETLEVSVAEHIATVVINRPAKLNAINARVVADLTAAFAELEARGDVRVAVLTGSGDKAFVAGADISEMAELGPEAAAKFARAGHDLGERMATVGYPIIAAVNGFALGGGTELALACDLIVASEKSKFGQPEVGLGVIPGFGGTVRLARRVGVGRARELIYTGAIIGAARAREIGLADRVVADDAFAAEVKALAEAIAKNAPLAVGHAKRVMNAVENVPAGVAKELEIQGFALCFATEDQKSGMRTFVGNPRAVRVFSGR